MKKGVLGLGLLLLANGLGAQCIPELTANVLDGGYVQENIPTKRIIPYASLREADVIWSKRVWRTIDLREKNNFPLFYPLEPTNDRMSLWDLMKCNILNEASITPYEVNGDLELDFDGQFINPITHTHGNIRDSSYRAKLNNLFFRQSIVPIVNEEGEPVFNPNWSEAIMIDYSPITSLEVVKYYVKEDWFFDKQRSVMDVRILGICPVINEYDDDGEFKGERMMFWVYFPECRYVFQNAFVYNRKNDAQRVSVDYLFWKRMFGSYIHKESNVYDRELSKYENDGVRALLEAANIKSKMEQIEHDVWHL
jgi:gliding motility associated protien GldN